MKLSSKPIKLDYQYPIAGSEVKTYYSITCARSFVRRCAGKNPKIIKGVIYATDGKGKIHCDGIDPRILV